MGCFESTHKRLNNTHIPAPLKCTPTCVFTPTRNPIQYRPWNSKCTPNPTNYHLEDR
jgi:hypothetical protein